MTTPPPHVPTAGEQAGTCYVLGVDGGGSKTLAWLAVHTSAHRHVVGQGLAGPGNPQGMGIELAGANILAAIHAAFQTARVPVQKVHGACLALAGAGREKLRSDMLRWAQAADIAERVEVVHDAQAVLAGGQATGCGIALICGTGSFAYGEAPSGRVARSGGWGYLWGDEGSGYAIGAAALRAVARACDRRGPVTRLSDKLLEFFQVDHPQQLIPAVYNQPDPRRAVAALVPAVFAVADGGDDVANRIRQDAAWELALLVQAVASQLDLSPAQYPLALAGSVLVHCATFAAQLRAALASLRCEPCAVRVVAEPVLGAVELAARGG